MPWSDGGFNITEQEQKKIEQEKAAEAREAALKARQNVFDDLFENAVSTEFTPAERELLGQVTSRDGVRAVGTTLTIDPALVQEIKNNFRP